MIFSFGKIRLGSPDHRWCLLAATTRSQYLATSRLVGSPEPPPEALASWSRAIVHRLWPGFTLYEVGWSFSLGSVCSPEPELPSPELPPLRVLVDGGGGGSFLAVEGGPAAWNG